MAQYQMGNKPISKPDVIQCTDAYIHDQFPIHQFNVKTNVKYEDEWWNSVDYEQFTFLSGIFSHLIGDSLPGGHAYSSVQDASLTCL